MEAKIEATRHEFQTQLKEVEAGDKHGRGTDTSMAQPSNFNVTSWTMIRRHFETIAEHNCWTCQEKSTYLITLLGPATDVLHKVPKGATY